MSLAGAPHGRAAEAAPFGRAQRCVWVCLVERWVRTDKGGLCCATLYPLSWLSVLVGFGEGTGVFEDNIREGV